MPLGGIFTQGMQRLKINTLDMLDELVKPIGI